MYPTGYFDYAPNAGSGTTANQKTQENQWHVLSEERDIRYDIRLCRLGIMHPQNGDICHIFFFFRFRSGSCYCWHSCWWWPFQLATAWRSARSFKRTAVEVQMLRVKPCWFQDQARYARGGVIMCDDWWLCYQIMRLSIRIPCEKERKIPTLFGDSLFADVCPRKTP